MPDEAHALSTSPEDAPGAGAEYELAEQDAQHAQTPAPSPDSLRPDQRPAPGDPATDADDVRRGLEQLDRVISK